MSADQAAERPHLWEYDHPYYCAEGSYWVGGGRFYEVHEQYDSWANFKEDAGWYDANKDYNLLFRWDWKRADPADYEYELKEDPDFKLPGDQLELFYMGQRKARNSSVFVNVTEADEPEVRAWLAEHAAHMRRVWEPLLDSAADTTNETGDES